MSCQNANCPTPPNPVKDLAQKISNQSKLANDNKKLEPSCSHKLWVSFFFDGTNNNRDRDLINAGKPRSKCEHSNIVSLFDSAKLDPKENYFKYYIQGVGTTFKEINETVPDDDGLAMAKGGQKRISYAYYQLCNSINYAIHKSTIFKDSDFKTEIKLNVSNANPATGVKDSFKAIQNKLISNIGKNQNTPKIEIVNIAVFGFSRGAAEARVFCRWLEMSCTRKGDTWLFAGCIPIRLYFLGIFDTVASVGAAHSAPFLGRKPGHSSDGVLDGQMDWASPTMLKVTSFVEQCRHYVAAHEIRYSFPLTSIRHTDGSMPRNAIEIVYPGSHSDVGGGYGPGDQGKSVGHRKKLLSQIPLLNMYADATKAGVPLYPTSMLNKLDIGVDFECDPDLIKRFQAYMAWAKAPSGKTEDMLYFHLRKYWEWRLATSSKYTQQNCMLELKKGTQRSPRSDKQDYEDMMASEEDWLNEVRHPTNDDSGEFLDLMGLVGTTTDQSVPKDVHDFFDRHVHDSHASFYMLGATTTWQKQKHAVKAMKAAKEASRDKKLLDPYMQSILKNTHGNPNDPASIDVSNFPVVTDKDMPSLKAADGFSSKFAGTLMTNTRREKGGHAHQRATFVGSTAQYGKAGQHAYTPKPDTLKQKQDALAQQHANSIRMKNMQYQAQRTALQNAGIPVDKLDAKHVQDIDDLNRNFQEKL
ncbi:T6SS phospholipase effector Tle1-like catalytic domain-containing protein [Chromobacterium phragmitis]|uniref:DUF2235 domain-containing protein n=1 Tax=Chromobacterium phragmitis TaxID=2202141 RepID=A0ABV0ISE6_9NEIS